MCDGKCCNDLGSSPQAQLLYVCVCITYAVVASASLLLNIVAEAVSKVGISVVNH